MNALCDKIRVAYAYSSVWAKHVHCAIKEHFGSDSSFSGDLLGRVKASCPQALMAPKRTSKAKAAAKTGAKAAAKREPLRVARPTSEAASSSSGPPVVSDVWQNQAIALCIVYMLMAF